MLLLIVVLIVLVREFEYRRGEILNLVAKVKNDRLLRAPSVGKHNSTRVDEGRKGWNLLAIKMQGTNIITEEGARRACYNITPDLSLWVTEIEKNGWISQMGWKKKTNVQLQGKLWQWTILSRTGEFLLLTILALPGLLIQQYEQFLWPCFFHTWAVTTTTTATTALPACPFSSTCVTSGISRHTQPEGEPCVYIYLVTILFYNALYAVSVYHVLH